MNNCPICYQQAVYQLLDDRRLEWRCERCGYFTITGGAEKLLENSPAPIDSNTLSAIGIIDFLKSLASDPGAPPDQIEGEFFAKGRPSSLLQRMIEPEEIANLVAYVASPLSSATNGAALRVDGGVIPTIG